MGNKLTRNKAPLVQTDIMELGDKRLSPEEALIREREELLKQAATRRIAGQDELEDVNRSSGARMSYVDVIRRVRKANYEIHVVDGAPGNVAFYLPRKKHEFPDPQERDWTKSEFFWDHRYIGGCPKTELPEFSHVDVDASRLATRENIRSWRSVLISLVKTGALSYSEAVREFGEPVGPRGGRWFDQLKEYRRYPHLRVSGLHLKTQEEITV